MIIMALDAALRTGVAIGEAGQAPFLEYVDFNREHDDKPDIFGRAIKWIARTCVERTPALLVIEGVVPQYDKTIQSGLFAIFTGVANAKGIKVLVAPIQTWRAFVLGDGKLPKAKAKQRAVSVVHQLGWAEADVDHNAAEAGCQWLWGCSQVEPKSVPRIPLFMKESRPAGKREMRGAA